MWCKDLLKEKKNSNFCLRLNRTLVDHDHLAYQVLDLEAQLWIINITKAGRNQTQYQRLPQYPFTTLQHDQHLDKMHQVSNPISKFYRKQFNNLK